MSVKSVEERQSGMRFSYADQEALLEHLFKKCSVRLGTRDEYRERRDLLSRIEASVAHGRFSPRSRGFLCSSKGNGVARYVPVLDSWTSIVYFACVRAIDEACADVAVDGTFGGWSLGGKRRRTEEEQVKKLIDPPSDAADAASVAVAKVEVRDDDPRLEDSDIGEGETEADIEGEISTPVSPYNKLAWLENWQEFWKVLALQTEQHSDSAIFVSFDLANYYDTVDLTLLESRLRARCPDETDAINVLFNLLRNWNRALRGYQETSKGIPMDIVGDMSRVLANFNLVDFDAKFKSDVEQNGGKFVRWADDMFFTCTSQDVVTPLLYRASRLLHSIGLNINSSKVRIRTKGDFLKAWRFDILDKLQSEDTAKEGADLLMAAWKDPAFERKVTALRRSLTVLKGLPCQKDERQWAYKRAIETPEFCMALSSGQLQSLIVCSEDPSSCIPHLSHLLMENPFTQPKVEWLRCLERQRKNAEAAYGDAYKNVHAALLDSGHPILTLAATNGEAP